MDARKEEDRDEDELITQVKPLLEQAEKILNETQGAVKGADPNNRLSNKARRNMQDHKATPEEQRLAEALKVVSHPYCYKILATPLHCHTSSFLRM
jgi:hypothetical protein